MKTRFTAPLAFNAAAIRSPGRFNTLNLVPQRATSPTLAAKPAPTFGKRVAK